jgi:hypothetical protein
MRSISTGPSPVLAVVGSAGQHRVCGRGRVDGVGLAAAAASGPVRPVDLHHAHVVTAQVSSQRGA